MPSMSRSSDVVRAPVPPVCRLFADVPANNNEVSESLKNSVRLELDINREPFRVAKGASHPLSTTGRVRRGEDGTPTSSLLLPLE